MGPVASQEVIKKLGTNGGGFFNVNSAHPFENPTAFTNFFEMLLVLIIPAALVFTYGRMTGNRRQGYAIYGVMMFMFLGAVIVAYIAEAHGSPAQHAAGLHTHAIAGSTRRQPGRQGAALRDRRARRCSTSSRPSPPAARSTARSSPSRASAAPCRWPTCRPAR